MKPIATSLAELLPPTIIPEKDNRTFCCGNEAIVFRLLLFKLCLRDTKVAVNHNRLLSHI